MYRTVRFQIVSGSFEREVGREYDPAVAPSKEAFRITQSMGSLSRFKIGSTERSFPRPGARHFNDVFDKCQAP